MHNNSDIMLEVDTHNKGSRLWQCSFRSVPRVTVTTGIHRWQVSAVTLIVVCLLVAAEIGNFYYGPGHPMKPHRKIISVPFICLGICHVSACRRTAALLLSLRWAASVIKDWPEGSSD